MRSKSRLYYKWHLFPYSIQIHWATLAVVLVTVVGIAAGVLLPGQKSRASGTPITVAGTASVVNTGSTIDFNASPYSSNVVIDDTSKAFDGYAWNPDLGWIAFGSTDNPNGAVTVSSVTGVVSGKARILATGTDLDFNASPYHSNVVINGSGVFSGYAWSTDLGWVNFTGVTATGLSFTPPGAPRNVRVYDVSDRALTDYALLVRWQEPASFDPSSFQAYLVERSTNGTTYSQVASITSRAYYDTSVTSGTKYYYRIKTQNTIGVTETSDVVTATPTGKFTSPPTLLSGPEYTISPTSIDVKWVTDRVSNSFVQIKDGNTFVSEQGQTEQVTSHEVKVLGLRSQKDYVFSIRSADVDGNILTGNEISFTTANSPSVYDMNVTNITLTTGIINFKSTSVANFTLYYGKTTDYGTTLTETSGQQTTNHSISLTGLTPGTTYYYRVRGDDADGNELRTENSFSTLPMPTISKLQIQPDKDQPTTTLSVTWETNVPTTSTVHYSADGAKFLDESTSDLVVAHQITLNNLSDNSEYTLFALGRDQFGNSVQSDKVTFKTPFDTRPPKIYDIAIEASNIGVNGQQKSQVIVSWKTDELANSQVEYGEGIGGTDYTNKTSLDTTSTNSHLVIISNLDQGKPYHMRILSADQAGNLSTSYDNTVITGEVPRSALQVILNTLENTFGWVGKLFGG